jgi:cation transport regulator ChaC
MDAVWYFGYGSNMSRAVFVERRKMEPLASQVAWLDDFRLCFNIPVGPGERGVANIEAASGERICGVAYLLTPEGFDRLDRTEGVHAGVYRRLPVELRLAGGERLTAFTYQSALTVEGRKPSPRYMGLLLGGAADHGLPSDYVSFLRSFTLAHDEREPQAQEQ